MRVLQLHNHHASKGGAMEVLAHEAQLLSEAGHEVRDYTLAATEDLGLSPVRAGVKAVWNTEAVRDVGRIVDDFAPDVMHVHTPFPLMSPAVFRVAHRRGVPTLTTLHSYRYSCVAGTCVRDDRICEDCVGSRLKLAGVRHRCYHDSLAASASLTLSLGVHRATGTFHRYVDRYLTLTEFSRQLLVRDGFPEQKITVKPNSVPDPGMRQHARTDERRVVFAGRLIDIKGIRTLLDAWQAVPPGMKLVVAGDGPLRPLVEERVARDHSVEFLGWVSEAEVIDLMGDAELVVVPSEWYEGLPLVILRSLAVGTPILVADLDNFSEDVLADGVGWNFAVGDARSCANALTDRVHDARGARSIRTAARASYERRYAPDVDLERLESTYLAVIAERRA